MTMVGKEIYDTINDKEGKNPSNPLGKTTVNVFLHVCIFVRIIFERVHDKVLSFLMDMCVCGH